MKPDWKDAPEWANWLAMDGDGEWYWYEKNPKPGDTMFFSDGRFKSAEPKLTTWKASRERRP